MAEYKTYKKERNIYFALGLAACFLPFIIVTACLFPLMREVEEGTKIAVGMGIIFVNAIPFLAGLLKSFFLHHPMLNMAVFAAVFLAFGMFFTSKMFTDYVDTFMWIELTVFVGAVAGDFFWAKYRKYKRYAISMEATIKSGAFKREDK